MNWTTKHNNELCCGAAILLWVAGCTLEFNWVVM